MIPVCEKKLHTKEGCITAIRRRKPRITGSISGGQQVKRVARPYHCTEKYGKSITGRYLKAFTSIIKTKIHRIMTLVISNALTKKPTWKDTGAVIFRKRIWLTLARGERKLLSGADPQRGKRGTRSTENISGVSLEKGVSSRARRAGRHFIRRKKLQNSVQGNATGSIRLFSIARTFARSVVKRFLLEMKKLNCVLCHAGTKIGTGETERNQGRITWVAG